MEQQLDPETYRKIANRIEKDLDELIAYSERVERISVPVVGNLQIFPRLSPEMRILGQQLSFAQEKANEAIDILNTLADLKEAENNGDKEIAPVPKLFKAQLEDQVKTLTEFYTSNGQQPEKKEDKKQSIKKNK